MEYLLRHLPGIIEFSGEKESLQRQNQSLSASAQFSA
jgi:hypothetical protein